MPDNRHRIVFIPQIMRASVRNLAILCGVQCALAAALAEGPTPAADYYEITNQVAQAVDADDFAGLEKLEGRLRTSRAMQANGTWGLRTFYYAVALRARGPGEDIASIAREETFLQRWRKAIPDSLAAPVLLGVAFTKHAFLMRGGDYAAKVTAEQWAGYKAYLERAQDAFSSNASAQKANPAWYSARLTVATTDTMTTSEFSSLLQESLAIAPDYNEPLRAVVHYASPQWGGSPELVEKIGKVALKAAGPEAYAVLYTEAFRMTPCHCEYKVEDLQIQWPVFDQGAWARLDKYRGSYFVNMYAAIACNSGRVGSRDKLVPRLIEQGKRLDVWKEFEQLPACTRWINSFPAREVAA